VAARLGKKGCVCPGSLRAVWLAKGAFPWQDDFHIELCMASVFSIVTHERMF
jgi:hypothetical protein